MICDLSSCELLKLKSDFGLEPIDKDFEDMNIHEKNLTFDGFEPLTLVRDLPQGKSVSGRFYFRGVYLCDTIENADFLIKDGVYALEKTFSPKFKRQLFEIVGVVGRSRLLIHAGNYYYDSKGCIIPGIIPSGKRYVNYSTITLDRLHRVISECSITTIKIISYYE